MRLLRHPSASIRWTGLVALLLVSAGAVEPRHASGQPGDDLTVLGVGVATQDAEYAVAQFAVYGDAPTPDEAQASVMARSEPVRQALRAAGVAEEDLQTSFTVQSFPPAPDPSAGTRTEWVSRAEDRYQLTVWDLARLESLIDLAIETGVNATYTVRFEIHDPQQLYDAAYANALRDARQRAEQEASARGRQVGGQELVTQHRATRNQTYISIKGGAAGWAPYRLHTQRVELAVTYLLRH